MSYKMVSLILFFSCWKIKSTMSFYYLLVSSVCKEVLPTIEEEVEEEKKAEDGMPESIICFLRHYFRYSNIELVDCYDAMIIFKKFIFCFFNIVFQKSSIQRKQSRRQGKVPVVCYCVFEHYVLEKEWLQYFMLPSKLMQEAKDIFQLW